MLSRDFSAEWRNHRDEVFVWPTKCFSVAVMQRREPQENCLTTNSVCQTSTSSLREVETFVRESNISYGKRHNALNAT